MATDSPFGHWLDIVVSIHTDRADQIAARIASAANHLNTAASEDGRTDAEADAQRRSMRDDALSLHAIAHEIRRSLAHRRNLERARAENAAQRKEA